MSTSMIRSLYNNARRTVRKEETKETAFAGATGFALGYMGHKMGGLDHNGIPLDALGGLALMYGGTFIPVVRDYDKRTREIGSAAIAVGMARVGERAAAGGGILPHHGAKHHGDLTEGMNGSPGAFGMESSLARAAAKL